MNDGIPFLYDELVERILSSGRDRPRVLIWAGRSLGKTGVLTEIRRRLEARFPMEATWVDGKQESGDPVGQIRSWADNPSGVLLVDDLDRCYGTALEGVLKSLPEDAEGRWRIVITVCQLDDIDAQSGWAGSPSLNTFHREALDPWESLGQATGAIKDALASLGRSYRQQGAQGAMAPILSGRAHDLVEAWVGAMVDVSEGHPALLRAAFDALKKLVDRYTSLPTVGRRLMTLPTDQEGLQRWRREVHDYLSDQVYESSDGRGAIQAAIKYYRRNRPGDFATLVDLAHAKEGKDLPTARLRHSLKESGLVFRHPGTGRLKVAGALTREWILQIAEEAAERGGELQGQAQATKRRGRPRKTHTEPEPTTPVVPYHLQLDPIDSSSGKLRILEPTGYPELKFRGKKWQVLKALESSGDKPISVEEIREGGDFVSDASVRSNLQRLREQLQKHGIVGLVETVHGKGFRLRRRGST